MFSCNQTRNPKSLKSNNLTPTPHSRGSALLSIYTVPGSRRSRPKNPSFLSSLLPQLLASPYPRPSFPTQMLVQFLHRKSARPQNQSLHFPPFQHFPKTHSSQSSPPQQLPRSNRMRLSSQPPRHYSPSPLHQHPPPSQPRNHQSPQKAREPAAVTSLPSPSAWLAIHHLDPCSCFQHLARRGLLEPEKLHLQPGVPLSGLFLALLNYFESLSVSREGVQETSISTLLP